MPSDAAAVFYIAAFGAGIALLGSVFGVLAIFITFVSRSYRKLLAATPDGLKGAMHPYKIVAGVAAASALWSIAAFGLVGRAPEWLSAIMLGIDCGLIVWLVLGVYQVLLVTVNHLTDSHLWDDLVARETKKFDREQPK